MTPDARIPALDGLRAIASLTVVFYHFFPHIARDPNATSWILHAFPRSGEEGVNLFFVLSGFLISGILVNARSSPNYFSTFYARRAFRIFPLYYIVLATYLVALAVAGPGSAALGRLLDPQLPVWTFVLYVQNFAMAFAGAYGATWMAGSWSLAVEEQFYLTLPAVVRWVSERTLMWIAVACAVLPIPLRAVIQHCKFIDGMANKVLLPTAVDSLAIGMLVMLALRYQPAWLQSRRRALGWITAGSVVGWIVVPLLMGDQAVRLAFLDPTATNVMCGLVLLHLLISPNAWLGRLLSRPTSRTLGNMAYSTYLFHPILLCLSFQLLRHADPSFTSLRDLGPIALAFVTTLIVSYGSWRLFETPLLKIGQRWRYDGKSVERPAGGQYVGQTFRSAPRQT